MSKLSSEELAAVDLVIAHAGTKNLRGDEVVPLFTPVATIIVEVTVATAAVVCAVPASDHDKIKKIKEIASTLEGTTSLKALLELKKKNS